ncbi:MAG: carbamoyltransferase [Betaproteobacteria bacterium]
MFVLGISAFYHDSAACLLKDGELVAAAQEERFTRKKHDNGFPKASISYCLVEGGISGDDVDHVVFYEKPFLKFERLLETYLAFAPKGFLSFSKAMPLWIKDKLFQKKVLVKELEHLLPGHRPWRDRLLFSEHHLSHAASAFFPSPFVEAAILTLDGVGEWTTSSVAVGSNNHVDIVKEIHFPHSLGLLYSAFTYYIGFKVNSGEYKVMGLAPYGAPKYADLIKERLIRIAEDGSFQLDMSFFDFATGLTMTNKKFHDLFGGSPREREAAITQRDMDLAASIQKVTEEVVLKIARHIASETGQRHLCLAGGVALNCVANGALHRSKIFEQIWVQPAAGDSGGAVGAALAAWHLHLKQPRRVRESQDAMSGSYLGPSFDSKEVRRRLVSCGAVCHELAEDEMIDKVASSIADGKAVGWMQGRMEFGPRALGARSILGDPRSANTQKQLNLKVKFRESFRPFAPSVLADEVGNWFEFDGDSPYMLMVAGVKAEHHVALQGEQAGVSGLEQLNIPRSTVPAITHVDYSARLQTVRYEDHRRYHKLIKKFHALTGVPMLVNTSFNVRGEPIVCTPEDAFRCFMATDLDVLAIENFVLYKTEQTADDQRGYIDGFELD